jgi:hypothetical protein
VERIQFADVLSDSARQAFLMHDAVLPWHYTDADIAILQQVKELLRRGRTYDEIHLELTSSLIDDQFDDQIAIGAPVQRRSIPEDTADAPSVPQPLDERTIANEDEMLAANEQALQIQHSQIDLLEERPQGSQEKHVALLRRLRHPEEWYRLLFQFGIIRVACGVIVLIAMLIVLLSNGQRVSISLSTLPNGTDMPSQQTVAALGPLVTATLTSRPATAELSTTRPLSAAGDRQQLTTAEATAQTARVPSAPPAPTLPAPEPAPAAAKPLPTTGPASAQVILLQVAEAEAALRMGRLEATITYGSGQRSSARVRFDLGDEQRVPRFHITTTYEGTTGAQATERITIGDQAWQRQQNGQWTVMPARESALKQLQVFFPRTDSISDPKRVIVEDTYVLHWYDAARDADVTLRVDAAGIPQQLRRVSRANGLTITVTYSGWNTPVEITPPD